MESAATGLTNLLAQLDPEQAKLFKTAENNVRFKEAVRRTWADNPDAAEFLLAHTNALYFAKDETPRKGPGKDEDRFVLGAYLDDSTARAELNARRERLQFAAAQEGIHVDEIRILPAQRGVKERHLFPESVERMAELFDPAPREQPAKRALVDDGEDFAAQDQARLLEVLKRAFCQAFGDVELAWAALEKIEGAALDEITFNRRSPHAVTRYWCHLYVADPSEFKKVIDAFGETIVSRAKQLKLSIGKIVVHESLPQMRGTHAFPRMGHPVPLASLDVREPPTQSARVAEEVRKKVNGVG